MNDKQINVLLLVDNDENDVLMTQSKIHRVKIPVRHLMVARSLKEAVSIVSSRPVDVVVLDLNLSDSTGLDTLQGLLERFSGPVVVLTSTADEETSLRAIEMGADDYLLKDDISEVRLRAVILYAIRRHRMRKAHDSICEGIDRLECLNKGK